MVSVFTFFALTGAFSTLGAGDFFAAFFFFASFEVIDLDGTLVLDVTAVSSAGLDVDFFLAKGNTLVGSSVLLLQKVRWLCMLKHRQNVRRAKL